MLVLVPVLVDDAALGSVTGLGAIACVAIGSSSPRALLKYSIEGNHFTQKCEE